MSCNTMELTKVLAVKNSIVQGVSYIAPEMEARVFFE